MIEFHRWTVYRQTDDGKGYTHLVVAGGLVLAACGVWHESEGGAERCEQFENWVICRSA